MRKPIVYVQAEDPSGPDPGTFRPDGSWDPRPQERTSCYRLTQKLQEARRLGASPHDIATLVAASPFPHLLGSSAKLWERLTDPQDWPLAQPATSVASTIKLTVCHYVPPHALNQPVLNLVQSHGWSAE